MTKKLAKIKYLQIIFKSSKQVIMLNVLSGKKIELEKLTYWSVEFQEPYYSYLEAFKKRRTQ